MLDPALDKYYQESFSTMTTEGWKYLMEDAERMLATYDKVSSVTETHSLDFRRGQLDLLNWLISRKAVFEDTYEQLQQEMEL